ATGASHGASSSKPSRADSLTLVSLQLLFQQSIPLTDGDGDTTTATASFDLGGNFQIGDDGPDITPGIFTSSQNLDFSIQVGQATGDNNISGTPGTNYRDQGQILLDFDPIYANQTIDVTLNVEIDGTWNYDGVFEPPLTSENTNIGSNQTDYFDDNWAIFVQDSQPGLNAVPDQVYYYNSTATNTPNTFPNSDPNVSTVLGPNVDSFVYGDPINSGFGQPGNGNLNNFTHTADVVAPLDVNGDLSLWIAAETTQTSETATIQGIANVQLTGPQLLDAVLIQVANTDATYANQNLASWDFGADGIINNLDGYSILGLDSAYSGVISQGATAQSLVLTISEAGSANTIAVFNLNSDSTASDSLQIRQTAQQENISFNLQVKDGDQDIDSITFNIQMGAPTTIPPISIDLDRDGKVDYLSRSEGQVFQDAETNIISNLAWVAPNDGLLVIDADQSGSINETREFAFTEWSNNAETDLQAVAEVFDTNQDGILDAQDERFDEFAVWQDLNSDAITDEGELSSLSELGIDSINLTYRDDSESRSEVGGDVTVFGQTTVSYEDGSTALAEDTSFARSIVSDPSSTADPTASDIGDQAATTQLASQDLSSEVSITALVNQFLETNPAEDDLIAQVHQELMDDGEPDSNPINLESLDDASYGDEDYDVELDLEIETIDLSNADLIDEMPLDFAEVYSSQA
ncbi:hypothetical protein, partial [Synechococcus sp. MU1655]|uniref:hypothetical protein n=1 Tax=Synechococcus sp. MU1655 TaxID=2508355 RepID=UPI0020274C7D